MPPPPPREALSSQNPIWTAPNWTQNSILDSLTPTSKLKICVHNQHMWLVPKTNNFMAILTPSFLNWLLSWTEEGIKMLVIDEAIPTRRCKRTKTLDRKCKRAGRGKGWNQACREPSHQPHRRGNHQLYKSSICAYTFMNGIGQQLSSFFCLLSLQQTTSQA